MFESIAKGLKKDKEVIDKLNFKLWETNQISIYECLFRFQENNSINGFIDLQEFERWLNSLGYKRK